MESLIKGGIWYILSYLCIRTLSMTEAGTTEEITPVLVNVSLATNRTDVIQTERKQNPDGITQYCLLWNNGSFRPYLEFSSGLKSARANQDALRYRDFNCTYCTCDITGYKLLLRGRVPADQIKNVLEEVENVWKDVYGKLLMDYVAADLDQWTTYFIGQKPDYTFHDPVFGSLTLLTYTVLVARAKLVDLQIPDLTQDELLAHAANFTYLPCGHCHPMLDQSIYLSGLPFNNTNAAVAIVLANVWNEWNRDVAAIGPITIQSNYTLTAGYNATVGSVILFPVELLNYTVIMPPGISWDMLDNVRVPSLALFNKHFRAEINPGVTVYLNEITQLEHDVNVGNLTLET